MGKSTENDNRERLIVVNPLVLEQHRGEGERSLHYYKRWRKLTLRTSTYEVQRIFHGLTRHSSIFEDIDLALDADRMDEDEKKREAERREFRELAKRAREDYDSLTDDEKIRFQNDHLTHLEPSANKQEYVLSGWADIIGLRSIELLNAGREEKKGRSKARTNFDSVKITIREVSEHHAGNLIHWTSELRRYDRDNPGRDYLLAELYLKHEAMQELCREIASREERPEIIIQTQVFLFQYEVEESLAEPWFSQSYGLLSDSSTQMFIEALSVGSEPTAGRTDLGPEDEGDDLVSDLFAVPSPDPEDEFRAAVRRDLKKASESIAQMRLALFVIAIAAIVLVLL